MPAGDRDESNVLGVETDLLDEVGGFLDDFLVTSLRPFGLRSIGQLAKTPERGRTHSVHLVDGDDELTDTEGEGEESVLSGLAIFRDTSLELTGTGGDDEDSAIGLRCTSDHVCTTSGHGHRLEDWSALTFDEITVTGSVNAVQKHISMLTQLAARERRTQ